MRTVITSLILTVFVNGLIVTQISEAFVASDYKHYADTTTPTTKTNLMSKLSSGPEYTHINRATNTNKNNVHHTAFQTSRYNRYCHYPSFYFKQRYRLSLFSTKSKIKETSSLSSEDDHQNNIRAQSEPKNTPMNKSKTIITEIQAESCIVPFGGSATPVENPDKNLLGGKGLGLQEMSKIGVQVPPGFTLTTDLCRIFEESDSDLPHTIWDGIKKAIQLVEQDTGKVYGTRTGNPLLFSCRSGAAISMPGMMDTVLNIVRKLSFSL